MPPSSVGPKSTTMSHFEFLGCKKQTEFPVWFYLIHAFCYINLVLIVWNPKFVIA